MDKFIVVPNHIHGVINIVGAGFPRPIYDDNNNVDNDRLFGRGNRAPAVGRITENPTRESTITAPKTRKRS